MDMRITIITVGQKPPAAIAGLIDTYLRRLPAKLSVDWVYCPHADGNPTHSKQKESENILNVIPDKAYVILFDETGKNLTSQEFSHTLFDTARDKALIIGGAYGVSVAVAQRADIIVSISRFVFPHQLVRLMVAEQLYRAYTISVQHPYHHA